MRRTEKGAYYITRFTTLVKYNKHPSIKLLLSLNFPFCKPSQGSKLQKTSSLTRVTSVKSVHYQIHKIHQIHQFHQIHKSPHISTFLLEMHILSTPHKFQNIKSSKICKIQDAFISLKFFLKSLKIRSGHISLSL